MLFWWIFIFVIFKRLKPIFVKIAFIICYYLLRHWDVDEMRSKRCLSESRGLSFLFLSSSCAKEPASSCGMSSLKYSGSSFMQSKNATRWASRERIRRQRDSHSIHEDPLILFHVYSNDTDAFILVLLNNVRYHTSSKFCLNS